MNSLQSDMPCAKINMSKVSKYFYKYYHSDLSWFHQHLKKTLCLKPDQFKQGEQLLDNRQYLPAALHKGRICAHDQKKKNLEDA